MEEWNLLTACYSGRNATSREHEVVAIICIEMLRIMSTLDNNCTAYPPKDLETCVSQEDKTTITLRVTWKQTEEYFVGHPNKTFYLSIFNASALVSQTMQVVGQVSGLYP